MLNNHFTAGLQKSPRKGGWTFVVVPDAVEHFGTPAVKGGLTDA